MKKKGKHHIGQDLRKSFSRIELKQTEQSGGYFLETKKSMQLPYYHPYLIRNEFQDVL